MLHSDFNINDGVHSNMPSSVPPNSVLIKTVPLRGTALAVKDIDSYFTLYKSRCYGPCWCKSRFTVQRTQPCANVEICFKMNSMKRAACSEKRAAHPPLAAFSAIFVNKIFST
jgi:hypothetical protein